MDEPSGEHSAHLPILRKWRCTHGHRWESVIKEVGIQIKAPFMEEAEEYCYHCLLELLREHLGKVREDT